VPTAARRKSLTSRAETRGGWHWLARRGASQSQSGAQGGGEGAGQWLEAVGDIEALTTKQMDGIGGFGSWRPMT
jgi:hypothetical protein